MRLIFELVPCPTISGDNHLDRRKLIFQQSQRNQREIEAFISDNAPDAQYAL